MGEAYQRRRKGELEALGSMVATAVNKPKSISKVIKAQPSRLHGGRQRAGAVPWWKREGG